MNIMFFLVWYDELECALVVGWEPCNLRQLGHVSYIGFVLIQVLHDPSELQVRICMIYLYMNCPMFGTVERISPKPQHVSAQQQPRARLRAATAPFPARVAYI